MIEYKTATCGEGTECRISKKRRRRLAIVSAIVAGFLALLFAVYFILSGAAPKEPDRDDIVLDYEFYEPDFFLTVEDIMKEPEYADVGWYITYTNEMGESVVILDDDYLKYGIGVELFSYYFAAIQSGNAKAYNALFCDEYIERNGAKSNFTPQRVYDIRIRLCNSEHPDDDTYLYTYEVDYKIMKNDGTFTRQIGSDMSRKQYFKIRSDSADTSIISIDTVYRG